MTRRRLSAIALSACLALSTLAPAAAAWGQNELPQDLIRAGSLNGQQVDQIRQYAGQSVEELGSADPKAVKRVRDRLLSPLRGRDISVAFRQEYSNQVVPALKQLPAGESDVCAVNVLRIAGELATVDSAALLEQYLRDERVAVRYAAVAGIGRTFDAVNANNPAITRDGGQRLITKIAERIEKEPSPAVIDASVRALISAAGVNRAGFEVRQAALQNLARSMGNRMKAAGAQPNDPEMLEPALRAGIAIRDALTVNNPGLALDAAGARQAAEFNGHLLSYVVRRLRAADFPQGQPELREGPSQLISVAETAIPLAADRLGGRVAIPPGMVSDFRKADAAGDRDFFRKALETIALLQREPFTFPAGTFLVEDGGRAGAR